MTKATNHDGIDVDNPRLGAGSIKQVKEGRYKGKWRLQRTYLVGEERERVDKIFLLKGDATKWRDAKKVELKSGVRASAVTSRTVLKVQAV